MSNPSGNPQSIRSDQQVKSDDLPDIYRCLTAYIKLNLVYIMAKWKLADLLNGRTLPSTDLAHMCQVPEKMLTRICNGLVYYGFLSFHDGMIGLTEKGNYLKSGADNSMYHLALLAGSQFNPAWTRLADAVQLRKTGFELVFGETLFAYNNPQRKQEGSFHQFMSEISNDLAVSLLQVYDFSGTDLIADIAGGDGTLIKAILKATPSARGLLFEDPSVANLASNNVSDLLTAGRLHIRQGDIFSGVPEGCDLYILSQILHDWPDSDCIRILENCRQAMKDDSRLLILTYLLDGLDPMQNPAIISDLNMLVLTGGRERSEHEYHELLEESGLRLVETTPMRQGYFLLVAEPQ